MKKSIIKKSAILALVTLSIVLCSCNTADKPLTETTMQTIVTTEKTSKQAKATEDPATEAPATEEPATEESIAGEPTTAERITDSVKDESWKQIYIDYLNGSDNANNFEYALVYVDEDEIPELYKHGKQRPMSSEICWIYDGNVYSQRLMIDGFKYYEKGNLFFSTGTQSGVQGDFVYSLSGSETIQKAQGTASRAIQGHERFTWNGEDVTENEYNSLRAEAFDFSKANSADNFESFDSIKQVIENL